LRHAILAGGGGRDEVSSKIRKTTVTITMTTRTSLESMTISRSCFVDGRLIQHDGVVTSSFVHCNQQSIRTTRTWCSTLTNQTVFFRRLPTYVGTHSVSTIYQLAVRRMGPYIISKQIGFLVANDDHALVHIFCGRCARSCTFVSRTMSHLTCCMERSISTLHSTNPTTLVHHHSSS
jgi:hypothetical protein